MFTASQLSVEVGFFGWKMDLVSQKVNVLMHDYPSIIDFFYS